MLMNLYLFELAPLSENSHIIIRSSNFLVFFYFIGESRSFRLNYKDDVKKKKKMWYDCQWDNYPQKTKMTQKLIIVWVIFTNL